MTTPLQFVTPLGKFLRRWSLDELPQIYSILRGDLAVVGPRPALFNQYDLIELRTQAHVHTVRPGLTGWAQVNGRDEVSLAQKVALDRYYIEHRGVMLDLKILLLTAVKVLTKDGITH
jgi:O-antigen biosynthesis protein WbqP